MNASVDSFSYSYDILFPEMLNQFKETFMVNIEMHMFKHKPFLFVGGGGRGLIAVLYGKNSP